MVYVLNSSISHDNKLDLRDLNVYHTWQEADDARWENVDYWNHYVVQEMTEGVEFYIVQPAGGFERGMIRDAEAYDDEIDAYVALSEFALPMEVVRVYIGQFNLECELLVTSV